MSRYRTLRPLGTGPDGVVEEVLPDRLGGEPLARRRVTVPAGPRRARLRDITEVLARLGHPSIATVVDIVEVDDSLVEVLTTLGTDGTLADRAGAGPIPAEVVRDTVEPLVDALRSAHGAGITHGHVAATNVLLRDGRPLLADFGVREARSGRPHAEPFRADVRDLAGMAADLLDPDEDTPAARALRTLLHWAADDPDATLNDLCHGLGASRTPTQPPPTRPLAEVAPPGDPAAPRRRAPVVLAAAGVLLLGLLAGSAFVLAPAIGDDGRAPGETDVAGAAPAACEVVEGPLRADVDGDGCDERVDWRTGDAELAYAGPDGALLRFRVGRPGDELILGDWDCDGTATAAVVRADTGETFVFDGWAAEGETLAAEPGPALPAGATPAVVDDGGCDRIEPARS